MTTFTATYSPDDNKLRISASSRLDAATYERVKNAGFKWAPRQEIFVAPMWTPSRADLCIELAGSIEDEDTSLTQRAEERAERFEEYSGKRAKEATNAREHVQAISGRFEFGQPILIGHHSERKARKDAERIESGMRKAVQLWETADYWQERAAGAIAHAKYKELPAVRARRIKGLEADRRKRDKSKQEAELWLKLWKDCEAEPNAELQKAVALRIAGMCWLKMPRKEGDRPDFDQCPSAYDALTGGHSSLYAPRTLEEVIQVAKDFYPRSIAYLQRWIDHYENRIAYERAMLGEAGGLVGEKFDIQPGGRVLVRGEWAVVLRVNKREGKISSVRTNARFVPVRPIEEIKDYTPPTTEDAEKVKAVTKLAPLVNFPGEGFIEMTADEYKKKPGDYKGTRKAKATAEHGAYRYRTAYLAGSGYRIVPVYLSDSKRVDPPKPNDAAGPVSFEVKLSAAAIAESGQGMKTPCPVDEGKKVEAEKMAAMRQSLKAGVQVVTASQLFPTPEALAEEVAEAAEIEPGMTVLEPSAGTGNLLRAIRKVSEAQAICTAVEVNAKLCEQLRSVEPGTRVECADFLQMSPETLGSFDRVVMNPPFGNAEDIKHIEHALKFLTPGGRIVAICAAGPRQTERLGSLARQLGGSFETLPDGSFLASGTNVRAALFIATVRQVAHAAA